MHWTGFIDKSGYGRLGYKGCRSVPLQRAVYDLFVGPIPDDHDIDHVCHTLDLTCTRLGPLCLHRRCGNIQHLEAVPWIVNNQRAGGRLSHCINDHEYTPENSYTSPTGRRICVTCYVARTGHPPAYSEAFSHVLTAEELTARSMQTWDTRGRQPCGTRASYRRGCRCNSCIEANRAYDTAKSRLRRGLVVAS